MIPVNTLSYFPVYPQYNQTGSPNLVINQQSAFLPANQLANNYTNTHQQRNNNIETESINIYALYKNYKINRCKQKINNIETGKINIYENYKTNPEFQKLSKTEYFNNEAGTKNLVALVTNLEIGKLQAQISDYTIGDAISQGWLYKKEANTDITKCLKNINSVVENDKFSQRFKQFVLNQANNLTFHVMRLGDLDDYQSTNPNINRVESMIMSPIMIM